MLRADVSAEELDERINALESIVREMSSTLRSGNLVRLAALEYKFLSEAKFCCSICATVVRGDRRLLQDIFAPDDCARIWRMRRACEAMRTSYLTMKDDVREELMQSIASVEQVLKASSSGRRPVGTPGSEATPLGDDPLAPQHSSRSNGSPSPQVQGLISPSLQHDALAQVLAQTVWCSRDSDSASSSKCPSESSVCYPIAFNIYTPAQSGQTEEDACREISALGDSSDWTCAEQFARAPRPSDPRVQLDCFFAAMQEASLKALPSGVAASAAAGGSPAEGMVAALPSMHVDAAAVSLPPALGIADVAEAASAALQVAARTPTLLTGRKLESVLAKSFNLPERPPLKVNRQRELGAGVSLSRPGSQWKRRHDDVPPEPFVPRLWHRVGSPAWRSGPAASTCASVRPLRVASVRALCMP